MTKPPSLARIFTAGKDHTKNGELDRTRFIQSCGGDPDDPIVNMAVDNLLEGLKVLADASYERQLAVRA